MINKHNFLSGGLLLTLLAIVGMNLSGCSSKKPDPYLGLSAKQIYSQGQENAVKRKYSDAIKDFEALESNYPYGDYSAKGKLALMHAYYGKKEYIQLKAIADRFIKMYPNNPDVAYAHYMRGLASYEQYYSTVYRIFSIDRSKRESTFALQSFDDFKILLENFPKSKYASDARQRMVHLRNQMAKQELHVARYYLAKKAYLAAANRAKFIVTDFYETPVVEEALNIMVECYGNLKMPELEQHAVNLLKTNFSHNNK